MFIQLELEAKGLLEAIAFARSHHYLLLSNLDVEICVPELRHFLYKSEQSSQFILPACAAPYNDRSAQMELYSRYQHMHSKLSGARRRHLIYYEVSSNETLLTMVKPGEYELYCIFSSLCDQKFVLTAANRLLRYIGKESGNLFILNAPNWL